MNGLHHLHFLHENQCNPEDPESVLPTISKIIGPSYGSYQASPSNETMTVDLLFNGVVPPLPVPVCGTKGVKGGVFLNSRAGDGDGGVTEAADNKSFDPPYALCVVVLFPNVHLLCDIGPRECVERDEFLRNGGDEREMLSLEFEAIGLGSEDWQDD
ncbi:hypothetical protein K435DRAFT_872186 [Dendrothele bispora CBS 962.96]|uniref:Uncharacterized protein n=1 Tax=Dendrothele bispora (strain CBS 962.96) TaxID=1314807 RepID=A0A4S8L2M1_DENBC|nr:hypothetical protein K435DRAFT_872186 [Dendrothele bispora CBS 962.96]